MNKFGKLEINTPLL